VGGCEEGGEEVSRGYSLSQMIVFSLSGIYG
jgi:hypothetical protein